MSGLAWTEWRAQIARLLEKGEELEKVAARLGTEHDLPFEVRPQWPGLDWVAFGLDLQAFSTRVRRVASVIGAPDSVTGEHWLGSYDESAPDLVARWKWKDDNHVGAIEVTVRALQPVGCKVDPRSKRVAEENKLHPECAAVLKELEQ